MSQLEVDKVIPQSGTTLTLGESGDTVSVPSGATLDASNATLTLPDGSVTAAKLASTAVDNTNTNSTQPSGVGSMGTVSDRRLKKNIERIGKSSNGLNIYSLNI